MHKREREKENDDECDELASRVCDYARSGIGLGRATARAQRVLCARR